MGLIPEGHAHVVTDELERILLDTFAIQIINEYDLKNGYTKSKKKDHTYMATRYLQLQHHCKTGKTSGDGRSVWNGTWEHKGQVWDLSSCGTGATSLSPASANNKVFYQSGDPNISYGCGYSLVSEGIVDVLLSQIFNQNGIAAEEVLCVIEFKKQMGITVRVGQNLLRPAHFFRL